MANFTPDLAVNTVNAMRGTDQGNTAWKLQAKILAKWLTHPQRTETEFKHPLEATAVQLWGYAGACHHVALFHTRRS